MDDIELRDITRADAAWLIERHGQLYAKEEGFDESFQPVVAKIINGFMACHDKRCERAWIAWDDVQRLGSIFCVRKDEETARLRLFLVEPSARGRGLGHILIRTCIGFARDCGYQRLRLWTHASHRAACALYTKYGFEIQSETRVRSFGQDLIEQNWELDLWRPDDLAIPSGQE